ncbi:thiamine phosphate synthase [Citricoccus muralis]|uniref:thiamine phosphate synthase n=1 Tax=Citricoccus muralis TaxID=169134 RepID=UPI001FEAB9FA|nr:thiamine phosphate synthase [Citricoccus muralis]
MFHIGQHDLSPAQARSLLGSEVLIGRSTHDLDQARAAVEDPEVDYWLITNRGVDGSPGGGGASMSG